MRKKAQTYNRNEDEIFCNTEDYDNGNDYATVNDDGNNIYISIMPRGPNFGHGAQYTQSIFFYIKIC